MATMSITIPDAIAIRVVDALAFSNGWTPTITDINGNTIPNPDTKTQWAKNVLKNWIKNNVINYEASIAADIARAQAVANGESEIIIGD